MNTNNLPVLSVKNLSIRLKNTNEFLVRNLSFNVYLDEILSLIGNSGTGKSLTALAIMGLLPECKFLITADELKFDNIDLLNQRNKLRSFRGNRLFMIFQDWYSSFNPLIPCGKQIDHWICFHKSIYNNPAKKQRKALIFDSLDKLGFSDPARIYNSYPSKLSGGQLQRLLVSRILIASTFIKKPILIIADEPTTGLDPMLEIEILKLFSELISNSNMSLLFITHDFNAALQTSDRFLFLKDRKTEILNKDELQNENNNILISDHIIPVTKNPYPHKPNNTQNPFLSVSNLSKYYNKTGILKKSKREIKALSNINLQLFKGESLGVIGESGSGKTTLGRCIAGLTQPDAGKVELNGRIVHGVQKDIQMIYQAPFASLNPSMKAGESITEALRYEIQSNQNRQKRAFELLDKVGLESKFYNRYPHELSGGECQRIVIARVLAKNPSMIVADEPLSSLDIKNQLLILQLLRSLQKENNISMLFISHDVRAVANFCDRILILRDGCILEDSSTHDCISSPKHTYTKQLLKSAIVI